MSRSPLAFEAMTRERFYGLWHNTSDTMIRGLSRDPGDWDGIMARDRLACKCDGLSLRLRLVEQNGVAVKDGNHVRACLDCLIIVDTGFALHVDCTAGGRRACDSPECFGYEDVR